MDKHGKVGGAGPAARDLGHVAALAHELLSPLNAISGNATTLLQLGAELSPEERDRHLLTIRRISLRLSHELRDVLEAAQLGYGPLRVVPQRVSLSRLVRSHIASLREEVPTYNLVLGLPRTMPLFMQMLCR